MPLPFTKQNSPTSSPSAQDEFPMAIIVEEEIQIRQIDRSELIASSIAEKKPKQPHKYRKASPHTEQDALVQPSFKYRSKGITYLTPIRAYIGGLITITFVFSSILTMMVPVYLLITQHLDLISLIIPSVAILSALCYLTIALSCKCRVCRTPIYSFKGFLRHRKSHHLPLIGHTTSTALHLVLFFWFRCQSCGTSQKLIKGRRNS